MVLCSVSRCLFNISGRSLQCHSCLCNSQIYTFSDEEGKKVRFVCLLSFLSSYFCPSDLYTTAKSLFRLINSELVQKLRFSTHRHIIYLPVSSLFWSPLLKNLLIYQLGFVSIPDTSRPTWATHKTCKTPSAMCSLWAWAPNQQQPRDSTAHSFCSIDVGSTATSKHFCKTLGG